MTAGNLATTQAVVSLLDERSKAPEERDPTLLQVPTLFQAARLIGETLAEVVSSHAEEGQKAEASFGATLIMGGQIAGMEPRLFMIYAEGTFVETNEAFRGISAGWSTALQEALEGLPEFNIPSD
jgi:putative proteasome-type protease